MYPLSWLVHIRFSMFQQIHVDTSLFMSLITLNFHNFSPSCTNYPPHEVNLPNVFLSSLTLSPRFPPRSDPTDSYFKRWDNNLQPGGCVSARARSVCQRLKVVPRVVQVSRWAILMGNPERRSLAGSGRGPGPEWTCHRVLSTPPLVPLRCQQTWNIWSCVPEM